MNLPAHSLAKTIERRDVDATVFQQEILPANRPVIFRGLIDSWPAVQQGKKSPQDACEYLLQFYRGKAVPLLIGDPASKRHIFYEDGMTGLNFERRPASLADSLSLLLNHVDNADAPAIYMEALPLPDCLPHFTDAHALALLGGAVIPNIWIGNAVKVQTHFDLARNMACVVAGKRRFTLFPPEQLPNLYIGPLDFTPGGTPLSMVPLDNPDFDASRGFDRRWRAHKSPTWRPGTPCISRTPGGITSSRSRASTSSSTIGGTKASRRRSPTTRCSTPCWRSASCRPTSGRSGKACSSTSSSRRTGSRWVI